MLDITMQCLQVCWEGEIACFILFVYFLFTRRVLLFWPNNLIAVGLIQPEPAPILVWWLNEWKLSPKLV